MIQYDLFLVSQLLQRLLEDRRRSMEAMMQEGPGLAESLSGEEGEQATRHISTITTKWEALLLEAQSRSAQPVRYVRGMAVCACCKHQRNVDGAGMMVW